jgi:hypothetical protein
MGMIATEFQAFRDYLFTQGTYNEAYKKCTQINNFLQENFKMIIQKNSLLIFSVASAVFLITLALRKRLQNQSKQTH